MNHGSIPIVPAFPAPLGSNNRAPAIYDSNAAALFSSMKSFSAEPSDVFKRAANDLIVFMKDHRDTQFGTSMFSRLGSFHYLGVPNNKMAALLNWPDPSKIMLTAWNSPNHIPRLGFAAIDATSYLGYGVGFAALPNISFTNHCMLVDSVTDLNAADRDMGSASVANTFIASRQANSFQGRSNAASTDSALVPNSIGLGGFVRTGANAVDIVKDGVTLASRTTAATAFGSGEVTLLRAGTIYSLRRLRFALNALWSTQEQALFYPAYKTFNNAGW